MILLGEYSMSHSVTICPNANDAPVFGCNKWLFPMIQNLGLYEFFWDIKKKIFLMDLTFIVLTSDL